MKRSAYRNITLTHTEFYVLSLLSYKNLHEYGIWQDVVHQYATSAYPSRSTIHRILIRLSKRGYVGSFQGERHGRMFAIKSSGRRILDAEIMRLEKALNFARNASQNYSIKSQKTALHIC